MTQPDTVLTRSPGTFRQIDENLKRAFTPADPGPLPEDIMRLLSQLDGREGGATDVASTGPEQPSARDAANPYDQDPPRSPGGHLRNLLQKCASVLRQN